MIPVLAVPVLERYDLLVGMEKSINVEVGRYYVIDNGGRYDDSEPWESRHVCRPGGNIGFGASINLAIKANATAPWWLFANDDILFAPDDLNLVEEAMWAAGGPRIAALSGFSAFALNDKAVETVGWFDENYHPAYCEDNDYAWRADRLGVEYYTVPGNTVHLGSQTLGGNINYRTANHRTYAGNRAYHNRKWGGEPTVERFLTPFDAGGDPSVTEMPKLSRLREHAW